MKKKKAGTIPDIRTWALLSEKEIMGLEGSGVSLMPVNKQALLKALQKQ